MARSYQWYYDGTSIGGATSKTHTLTSGQTDQDRIECRTEVTYGTDSVAALAEYPAGGFAPADDTLLRGHWDASDTGSVTLDSTVVTAIADQTANNFDLAEEQDTQTGLEVGSQNSLATINRTGGTGSTLEGAFSIPVGGNIAIHTVMSIPAVPGNTNVGMYSFTDMWGVVSDNVTQWDGKLRPSITLVSLANKWSGGPYSGWINMSLIMDTTATKVYTYVGDTLVSTDNGYNGAAAPTDIKLFVDNFNVKMVGEFGEMCITTDLTNRSDYYSYLQSKWNVS